MIHFLVGGSHLVMNEQTVFISYRADETGRVAARLLKQELTRRGYSVFLDADCIDSGLWDPQLVSQASRRAHFILLLTEGALDRCISATDMVRREFLTAHVHRRNIVPLAIDEVDLDAMNDACPLDVKAIFTYQAARVRPGSSSFEDDVETLIRKFIAPHKAPREQQREVGFPCATSHTDISRLIEYAPAELIGREDELSVLDRAWAGVTKRELHRTHILTFVALGGEGKTSLVAKWLAAQAHQDWPGCDDVFAWSFYSQGTRAQTAVSSDLFLAEALTFFGDPETAGNAQSAFDKGRRLAQLVGGRQALLVLDGLEPLQYSPISPTGSKLKDQGLSALLKGLASASRGLCVVTTRYPIPDLRNFWQTTAPEFKLTSLSREAGVQLLRTLGVRGTRSQFDKLVEDVQGHALTLGLLGTYLRDAHGGDIQRRDRVKLEEADSENERGGHAFRVMDAYVQSLATDGEKGPRALALLSLLGLFDRPATSDCLAALLRAPAIPGLTEALMNLNEAQLNMALTRLANAKLLTVNYGAPSCGFSLSLPTSVDAHPLLRDYFGEKLRTKQPDAWRAAHWRLYEHLCANTPEKEQPNLEDLQPLYQALTHGCLAGRHEDARRAVYSERILRGDKSYSTKRLGAIETDLSALVCFFDTLWSQPEPSLHLLNQIWVMERASDALTALGHLSDASECMLACKEQLQNIENLPGLVSQESRLCELDLIRGEVGAAAERMQHFESYEFFRTALNGAPQLGSTAVSGIVEFLCSKAWTLHQSGKSAEARGWFKKAEGILTKAMINDKLVNYTNSESEPEVVANQTKAEILLAEAEAEILTAEAKSHSLPKSDEAKEKRVKAATEHKRASKLRKSLGISRCSKINMTIDVRPIPLQQGFRSCAVLMAGADRDAWRLFCSDILGESNSHLVILNEVAEHATKMQKWADKDRGGSLLDNALNQLVMSRSSLCRAILGGSATPIPDSIIAQVNSAVYDLRRTGMPLHLPLGLLTRAWLRSVIGTRTGTESAQSDLDEAWEIAERGPMPLFLADIHLYRARLFFRETTYPWKSPQKDLIEARRLIEKHGYLRRESELLDAENIILLKSAF